MKNETLCQLLRQELWRKLREKIPESYALAIFVDRIDIRLLFILQNSIIFKKPLSLKDLNHNKLLQQYFCLSGHK